jgi:predicted unusual protein kinase regulating ubiquinone biosynthesis (AarF/ABC1/UbiB family)
VPAEYSKQFEALCNAAPQTDFESVRQIVTEELGINSIDDYFVEFDPMPVASASLA